MDAIIYAAGVARRMGPEFQDTPKILLEVGGRSLLEWHARRLSDAGCARAHVVTGHGREKVAREIERLSKEYPARFMEIFNPDYTEGSVLSFHVSLPVLREAKEPVLIMDGDVFYGGAMLRRLIDSPHPTALLLDFGYRAIDDDPVLVPVRDGRPFEFVKKWQGEADRVGESIGFFKVDPADLPLLIQETELRVESGRRAESYDDVIRAMARAGRFGAEDVSDQEWTEIDFPYDLARARQEVFPALRAQGD
jgi:choline kinase